MDKVSHVPSSPRWSMGSRPTYAPKPATAATVGPGAYEPQMLQTQRRGNNFATGSPRLHSFTNSVPGPGGYSPEKPTRRIESHGFREKSDWGVKNNTPGPGHYSHRTVFR